MENSKNSSLSKLIPVMLCFFAMGFVDLVGIASNYVKADLGLSDSQANIFPSLVFFWFLIFSVPTGMLMSRIGQKKTVLLSLLVTFASLLLPVFGDSYMLMLISFSLLGIGNALMQTSLNPLLSNIVRGDRLASSLTFGQFVKAIASFLAPYIAMWGATQAIPSFDLGWRILFPVYMIVAVVAILLLNATQIEEEKEEGKPSTFGQCLALLGKPFILLCFIGIMCHVGIDVGTNTTAPKILMERIGMGLDDAAFATSLYFIFRTAGCFLGSFILRKMSAKSFFAVSVIMMLAAMIGLFIFHEKAIIYVCIALIGFGNSNVFSVIFSQALLYLPGKKNEVSGLMIMGLFGGTVFPLAMGVASDTSMGQNGAIAVMTVGVLYLLFYTFRIMNNIIVGMGEALWDVLPEGKKIGGAPANFAYHVSQFGFDSRVVSAVGNDELGDEIMSVFKEKKLNTQIERVDYPTGTVQVTLDAEGVPCYEIKEGVAWDNIPFTDELKRLALNTRAVCFGSLAQRNEASRATINRFLDTMPEIDGQLKIFDINLRQDFYTKEVLRDSFQRCNVLKINDEELVTISRMFGYPGIDLQDKCWILLAKYNLKMLILTCGINGSYVFTPGVVSFQETPKVPVADTVGAGDSFTAAFCASILNGKPVPEAHKLAVEVSAYVCTQSGAMPELPQVLKDRLL